MAQIAQQDNLYFTPASGTYATLTQAEQNWLVEKAKQGILFDVVFILGEDRTQSAKVFTYTYNPEDADLYAYIYTGGQMREIHAEYE